MNQSSGTDSPQPPKPVLQDAPPASKQHDPVEASDSGKPWILGMAAAVMMAVGLVIGSMLWSAPKMQPHVEPFLQAVSNQEYVKAYGMVSPEWRGVMTQDHFVQLHTEIRKLLGEYVSMRQLDFEENEDPLLGTVVIAHFDAHYANGDVALTAALRKAGDKWSLLDVQYVSPLIQGGPPAEAKTSEENTGRKVPDFIHGPEGPSKPGAKVNQPAAPAVKPEVPATQP